MSHARSFRLLRSAGFRPAVFVLSGFFSLLAALFDGASIGLIAPILNALLRLQGNGEGGGRAVALLTKVLPSLASPLRTHPVATFGALAIGCVVVKNAFQFEAGLLLMRELTGFTDELRRRFFGSFLKYGKKFHDASNAGHINNILLSYPGEIASQLSTLQYGLNNCFLLVVYLGIMLSISARLTFLVVAAFPVLHFGLAFMVARMTKASVAFTQERSLLGQESFNVLSCLTLVKTHGMEEAERLRFDARSDALRKQEFRILFLGSVRPQMQELILVFITCLLLGGMSYVARRPDAGPLAQFLVFFYVLKKSSTALGVLNGIDMSFAQVAGQIAEIVALLDVKGKDLMVDGRREFAGLTREIVYEGVTFRYPQAAGVLDRLDMTIRRGEKVALVGATGAGKSTTANMLLRFYEPDQGRITIDGTDIREFRCASLRADIAYVGQEAQLFHDTLKANIVYGIADPPSERVLWWTLEAARLADSVRRLPDGLATQVGDRGVKLSGGERQRVSIARALLKGAEILILDEATNALDSLTEKLVQEALENLMVGRTTLIIAHRLSTIMSADRVCVIEGGRIVEEGSPAALLKRDGRFKGYWDAQQARVA